MTKKKKLVIIIGIILFVFIIFSYLILDNTITPLTSFTSGDFICTTRHCNNGYCRIIGLSEEGKKKEILVFPNVIKQYKVECIGIKDIFKKNNIEITNAKKIYFTADYGIDINASISYVLSNDEQKFEIYLTSGYSSFNTAELEQIYKELYVNNHTRLVTSGVFYSKDYRLSRANVLYLVDDEIYFIDDCDGTVVSVIPPTPYKKGYNFVGWYKESECINKWDFENDMIPSKTYDEEGNYLFKETRLYAKWEKK